MRRGAGLDALDFDVEMLGVSVVRRTKALSVSLLVITAYLVLGGAVMWALEREHELEVITEIEDTLFNMTGEVEFDKFKRHLMDLGVCFFPSREQPNWSYMGATFYAFTVITTIGYGSLAPQTFSGKSFTVVYSIIGIALIGTILTNCARLLVYILKGLLQRASRVAGTQAGTGAVVGRITEGDAARVPTTAGEVQAAWDAAFDRLEKRRTAEGLPAEHLREVLELASGTVVPDGIVLYILEQVDCAGTGYLTRGAVGRAISLWHQVHAQLPDGCSLSRFLLYLLGTVVWVVAWGFAFSAVEGWELRNSIWFGFVTLTTIGFGDFAPHTPLGRVMAFLFVIPGMGLAAAVLGSIWRMFEYQRYWWLQRMYQKGHVSRKMLAVHGMVGMAAGRQYSKRSTQVAHLQKVAPPLLAEEDTVAVEDEEEDGGVELHLLRSLNASPASSPTDERACGATAATGTTAATGVSSQLVLCRSGGCLGGGGASGGGGGGGGSGAGDSLKTLGATRPSLSVHHPFVSMHSLRGSQDVAASPLGTPQARALSGPPRAHRRRFSDSDGGGGGEPPSPLPPLLSQSDDASRLAQVPSPPPALMRGLSRYAAPTLAAGDASGGELSPPTPVDSPQRGGSPAVAAILSGTLRPPASPLFRGGKEPQSPPHSRWSAAEATML